MVKEAEVNNSINVALLRISVEHSIALPDARIKISYKSGIHCEILGGVTVLKQTSLKDLLNISVLKAVLVSAKIESAFKKIAGNDFPHTDFRLFTMPGCNPKCYMFYNGKPLREIQIKELIN